MNDMLMMTTMSKTMDEDFLAVATKRVHDMLMMVLWCDSDVDDGDVQDDFLAVATLRVHGVCVAPTYHILLPPRSRERQLKYV